MWPTTSEGNAGDPPIGPPCPVRWGPIRGGVGGSLGDRSKRGCASQFVGDQSCRTQRYPVDFDHVLDRFFRATSWFLIPLLALGTGGASAQDVSTEEGSVEQCLEAHEDAQIKREMADLVGARDALRMCAAAACPALIQRDCVSLLAEIQRSVPSVVVDVVLAGNHIQPDAFWLDGVRQPIPEEPIELNPGLHQFRVRHAVDGTTVDETAEVVVQPAMRRQVIQLELRDPNAPISASEGARDTGRPLRLAGFGLLGLGLATGAATAGLGIAALRQRADANQSCAPFCSAATVDPIRAEFLGADILGAVTGAVILSSVVLLAVGYARRGGQASQKTPSMARTRMQARIEPTVGGFRIRW